MILQAAWRIGPWCSAIMLSYPLELVAPSYLQMVLNPTTPRSTGSAVPHLELQSQLECEPGCQPEGTARTDGPSIDADYHPATVPRCRVNDCDNAATRSNRR